MRQSFAMRGLVGLVLGLGWACSSETAAPTGMTTTGGGAAGVPGNMGGTQAMGGQAGQAAGGSPVASGGNPVGTSGGGSGGVAAGAGGAGGAAAGASGSPAAGMSNGGGGAGGAMAGAGAGGGGAAGAGGAAVSASCADHPEYDLCIDFESGIPAGWEGGTENSIDATHAAHGNNSYHLYSCTSPAMPTEDNGCDQAMTAGKLVAMNLGEITNQIWGRVYVHFSPGAPGGHGNLIEAYDQSNAWYEMGWQFDGIMGVWHAPGGAEHPRRSQPYIVDQWYCLEFFFDGTQTDMQKWWIDGPEAMYYDPMKADGNFVTEPGGPTPTIVTQFDRVGIGFTPYAGLGLRQPDTVGDQAEMRLLTDLWVDDIAFDTERIGCID